jgi:hypothetical protein
MNVKIGTEAAQFPGKEYLNGIFVAVWEAFSMHTDFKEIESKKSWHCPFKHCFLPPIVDFIIGMWKIPVFFLCNFPFWRRLWQIGGRGYNEDSFTEEAAAAWGHHRRRLSSSHNQGRRLIWLSFYLQIHIIRAFPKGVLSSGGGR